MRYHAEAWFTDTEDVAADLGHFETAAEDRSACASHDGAALSWQEPWDGMWYAQGKAYWYRVVAQRD